MNICLTCREVVTDLRGGLPRATCDLAEALAEAGHRVTLLTDDSPAPPPVLDGPVQLVRVGLADVESTFPGALPETALHNLMYAAAVWREVSRRHASDAPVDVVLAPLWRSEGAVCMLDRRWPTVVSCMTSLRTLVELDSGYAAIPDLRQRLAFEHAALQRSAYLHGLTHAVLDKTISDHALAPRATAVIGRGVADRARDAVRPVRSREPRDAPVHVVFVGRIEHRKGVDLLFASARELVASGASVRFTLAGPPADPALMAALEDALAQSGALADAVTLTGRVTDAELTSLYASADIVCVPSRYESHGIVLLEAMMSGAAIVTCAAGGIGEVVHDGHTALIVPGDDVAALTAALRRLIDDDALRARLGAAARAAYERRFEPDAVAAQMAAFFLRVRGTAVTRHRLPWRHRAQTGLPARLAGLIVDGLGLPPDEARVAAQRLLGIREPRTPGQLAAAIVRRLTEAPGRLLGPGAVKGRPGSSEEMLRHTIGSKSQPSAR
jgi:glycogen synthase